MHLYSGLNLNQDKARQRRTGLKLIRYISDGFDMEIGKWN
ncbi:hypothetical protein NEISICOT_01728 [Neisseria sicca ATCC 29256]|uniref:Uncharacterized protein n=1 Tax=Neisseria sicca ATCC 29256 TaxID=547045 RepID=C6M5C9_NEISI|nr:hypothetical protein NEISICOT_01728 [Neisseria sicca ATCC 29256]